MKYQGGTELCFTPLGCMFVLFFTQPVDLSAERFKGTS